MRLQERIKTILKEVSQEWRANVNPLDPDYRDINSQSGTSSRLPDYFYEDDYELDQNDLELVFDETDRGDRVRYFVDVYYDVMVPSSGDTEKDRILIEKIAKTDLRNLKNREYLLGSIELRGHYR